MLLLERLERFVRYSICPRHFKLIKETFASFPVRIPVARVSFCSIPASENMPQRDL